MKAVSEIVKSWVMITAEILQPVIDNTKLGLSIMPHFLASIQYVKLLSLHYTSHGAREAEGGRE